MNLVLDVIQFATTGQSDSPSWLAARFIMAALGLAFAAQYVLEMAL